MYIYIYDINSIIVVWYITIKKVTTFVHITLWLLPCYAYNIYIYIYKWFVVHCLLEAIRPSISRSGFYYMYCLLPIFFHSLANLPLGQLRNDSFFVKLSPGLNNSSKMMSSETILREQGFQAHVRMVFASAITSGPTAFWLTADSRAVKL